MPVLEPARALDHVLTAAADARRRLAAAEAVGHYRRALALVPDTDLATSAVVALDRGAALYGAGELTDARATFEHVVAVAHDLSEPRPLARAALGIHLLGHPGTGNDKRHEIDLLDAAREQLRVHDVPPDDPLAVRALAASSRARSTSQPVTRQPRS